MKEKALAIVEQLINDHKINGKEAITLINAINDQHIIYVKEFPSRTQGEPIPTINAPGTGNPGNLGPIPMGDPVLDPFRYGVTVTSTADENLQIKG